MVAQVMAMVALEVSRAAVEEVAAVVAEGKAEAAVTEEVEVVAAKAEEATEEVEEVEETEAAVMGVEAKVELAEGTAVPVEKAATTAEGQRTAAAEMVAACIASHSRRSRCRAGIALRCRTLRTGSRVRHPGRLRWRFARMCHHPTWVEARAAAMVVILGGSRERKITKRTGAGWPLRC